MNSKKIHVVDSKILLLGFTFKENCPDIRNTQAIKLYNEIKSNNAIVDIYDPEACTSEIQTEYGLNVLTELNDTKYDAIVVVVGHDEFKTYSKEKVRGMLKNKSVVMDLKGCFDKDLVDCCL
jgi:UDP-N-acetyl-D-galactosamine dehydrogenase